MGLFTHHLRTALRSIARKKTYSAINILGLALGMCACMVIYTVCRYELDFDTFHPDAERIYRIGARVQENSGNPFASAAYTDLIPPPVPAALRRQLPGLDEVAGFYLFRPGVTIREDGRKEKIFPNVTGVIIAEPSYFSIFTYEWLAGSPATALRNPYTVVLSERKALQYFGNQPAAELIGKEVIYNDSLHVSVTGIVKDWQQNTDFPFTDFISFSTIESSFLRNTFHPQDWRFRPGVSWMSAFVKRAPGSEPVRLSQQLETLFAPRFAADSFLHLINFNLVLQPLQDVHFNRAYSDGMRKAHLPALYTLMGIAALILVIALVNFINLSTAWSIQWGREAAMRKVLGSSRANLIMQFITETLVISFAGICIATLLTGPVLSAFRDFIPTGVAFHLFDPSTGAFILLMLPATSLLAGIYPSWYLSSSRPAFGLVRATGSMGSLNVRKLLIVVQFTISLILIMGVIVMRNQIRFMLSTDLGFRTSAVVTLGNWNDPQHHQPMLAEKIRRLPGVKSVVLQGHAPIGEAMLQQPVASGQRGIAPLMVSLQAGNADFIPFYRMKLLAGRNILVSDSLREWVINETYAKALGFTEPQEAIGQHLEWNGRSYPIAGVVADYHDGSFHQPIGPVLIGHIPALENSIGVLLNSAGGPASGLSFTLDKIEQEWKVVYPNEPFSFRFLDDTIAMLYKKEQQTAWLMSVAMCTAIFISCLGLFGLIAFMAERRAREIAVRKVLGASVSRIAVLLAADFLQLVFLSILIASPVANQLIRNWLQNFTYRVPISWWVFALAGTIAVLVALATISVQIIKAALANPADRLRSE